MKKFGILAVLLPIFAVSCSNDGGENEFETPGTGSISFSPSVDIDTEKVGSRATSTDFKDYTVILSGDGVDEKVTFPASGKIDELKAGDYTVTLTSHPDGFTPAFDEQVYEGSAQVTVKAGETATATIVCKQANAGVFFDYNDASLAANGLTDLVPTVTMGSDALVYSGGNKEATGYFNPGHAVVTLKNAGEDVSVNQQGNASLELGAEQLRKVKLTAAGTRAGNGPVVTVSFE